ncbi:MAG TPA: polysaccharide deacetylase family protein, partial [Fimbriimonadaceae bacterium]|nr:polysaccharide deacetylase family protein [Fimbriimonadaceae bacterium]
MTTAFTIAAPILMYHRIGSPQPGSIVRGQYVPCDLFEKQLRFLLRRGYSPMSLTEFVRCLSSHPKGVRPIAITFDDGYESVYTDALPVLRRQGMTATVFVVAGQMGDTNQWDKVKGDVTEPMMDVWQIRDAQRLGIEIGSHTSSHPDLLLCSEPRAVDEIAGSKRVLEELLGQPVDWFSYPYGR